jgi:purine-binding chemotaxis protein CheW
MSSENSENSGKRELIAFRIGEQDYGVDITTVREIRGFSSATPLPRSPSYVRGVINLRGTVLPIIDLAERLGFDPIQPTDRSVVVVVKIGAQLNGLLVDAVSDILTVTEDMIQPTPQFPAEAARSYVKGIIATEGRMISLIDVQETLPPKLDLAA